MTGIEWTERTWNPVTGCTRVSPGCLDCFIERQPPMRMAHRWFDGPQIGASTGVELHPERLEHPRRWRKPQMVFVNSMSDLFHDDVPDVFIAQVFTAMALAPRHTFQILTKRPARMRALLADLWFLEEVQERYAGNYDGEWTFTWPLRNVWLGVSTETQQWANLRIPILLATPAAVRFVSAEPLLGPIDLTTIPGTLTGIDWLIVGGESGPKARPMHPNWARALRDQCTETAAPVPFFFKQHGEFASSRSVGDRWEWADPAAWVRESDGQIGDEQTALAGGGSWCAVWRVGKKSAGRELDGRFWDEIPEPAGVPR
ncbi:phage Gp37/Gp68 family protein [Nocardia sp. NPDC051832]|uniref:phage Gp37/Gp68 family protein n=1 Tax=Nocardia sp. NPDC051832 TaxID=3155673 RepID=UPI0034151081